MPSTTFRTKPPISAPPLSREEMKAVADKVGLTKFSPGIVPDLVNIAEGGTFVRPSAYSQIVQEKAEKSAQKKAGEKPPSLGSIKTEFDRINAYHRKVCDFVREIHLDRFQGKTSLEKAMSLLKLLSKVSGGQPSGDGSGDDPLPIFSDSDSSASKTVEMLEDVIAEMQELTEEELDMIDPDGEGHDRKDNKQDGSRSGTGELQALKIAEKLMPGTDERKILDLARYLQQFVELQVKRLRRVKEDPTGPEIRQRPIRHLGEIGKLSPNELAKRAYLPRGYFNYLALTGRLELRERVVREDKKQGIFILMDISGSTSGEPRIKMSGIVMNRLLAVVKGDAEVYLGLFDTELKVLGSATNPEEARAMIKKFRAGNYSGGGTNIANGVKAAHAFIEEKIKSGEALWRPEVVVLTDEDSSASGVTAAEVPGTKVHGFAIGKKNPNLVKLCQSTGGLAFEDF